MLNKLRNTSKNSFVKITLGSLLTVLILSFAMWGTEDLIGATNKQNTVASVGNINAGHSERRIYCKETDAEVLKKALISFKHNISPIICIGESLEIRKKNEYLSFLSSQIINSIPDVSNDLLIAYEPVWSIGTGVIPKSSELLKTIDFIKDKARNNKVLYGGSVNPKNIRELKLIKNIDGFLIGGASQEAKKFIDIIKKTYN